MSELKEQIKELTLLLMYATAFRQTGRYEGDYWQAWKGYDFDAMNALNDEELIYDVRGKIWHFYVSAAHKPNVCVV